MLRLPVWATADSGVADHADLGSAGGARERDTGQVRDPRLHAGLLWSNSEPFPAVDAASDDARQGISTDEFDQVARLGTQDTSIPPGPGRAALAGEDTVVRHDSWLEIFEAAAVWWPSCRPSARAIGTR